MRQKSEGRRPRILIAGTSGYVGTGRMSRKLDRIFAGLKDPIVCTRVWWMHERKAQKNWQTTHLGAEFYGENWAYNKRFLIKRFHPAPGSKGRELADEEMMDYCTARRPCFAFFYGVDDSCRGLLRLCKKNGFVIRIVEEK